MSTDELADRVGISIDSMNKILNGELEPTFNQLERIARYFDRGILFFLSSDGITAEQAHSTAFRTIANKKPEISPQVRGLIQRAERQREIFLNLQEDLEESEVVRFAPPVVRRNSIDAAALAIREWLGLESQNTFDLYREALESKGVLVFRSNGYNGKWQIGKDNPILGFSIYDQTCPLIFVKKQRWETRQTFTLIHELAHLVLHKGSSIDDEMDLESSVGAEREANELAGKILLPDAMLELVNDADRPDDVTEFDIWLFPLRRQLGISTEVILRRLLSEGRLDHALYSRYRAWWNHESLQDAEDDGGNRMWRHREPKHIFGNRFIKTVFEALNSDQITLARASRYLDGLKVADIRELERHYAGL